LGKIHAGPRRIHGELGYVERALGRIHNALGGIHARPRRNHDDLGYVERAPGRSHDGLGYRYGSPACLLDSLAGTTVRPIPLAAAATRTLVLLALEVFNGIVKLLLLSAQRVVGVVELVLLALERIVCVVELRLLSAQRVVGVVELRLLTVERSPCRMERRGSAFDGLQVFFVSLLGTLAGAAE